MKLLRWIVILTVLSTLFGCSRQAWYDGFQMVREKECYDLQGNQREECLKNARTGYDKYRQDRQEVKEKDGE